MFCEFGPGYWSDLQKFASVMSTFWHFIAFLTIMKKNFHKEFSSTNDMKHPCGKFCLFTILVENFACSWVTFQNFGLIMGTFFQNVESVSTTPKVPSYD